MIRENDCSGLQPQQQPAGVVPILTLSVVVKPDLVVKHRVWFISNRSRRLPSAAEFGCVRNDVAVAADGSCFELLVTIHLKIVIVLVAQAFVVIVDRTVASSAECSRLNNRKPYTPMNGLSQRLEMTGRSNCSRITSLSLVRNQEVVG